MKVAFVHDDFTQLGGAENLFATIASLYPSAPIYTSLVNYQKLPEAIDSKRIHTSFIQNTPLAKNFFKAALPFYPLAFESFNLDNFDLVISSSTRFAKSIITKPETTHIAYINSTPRFLYDLEARKNYFPSILITFLSPMFSWLKRWDKAAASRVDYFIANSKNVKVKIKETYGRNSEVIYPFADLEFFKPLAENQKTKQSEHFNYFLIVNRLVKWKKIDIAIKACQELNQPLIIVGTGPDESRLKSMAALIESEIKFEGKVTSVQLRDLYRRSKALIVTQEEDFGIAAVEAQACGKPVIAYKKGGPAEIIQNKKTGLLFERQTVESLKGAIKRYSEVKWDETACCKNSKRFSQQIFVEKLKNSITRDGQGKLT